MLIIVLISLFCNVIKGTPALSAHPEPWRSLYHEANTDFHFTHNKLSTQRVLHMH